MAPPKKPEAPKPADDDVEMKDDATVAATSTVDGEKQEGDEQIPEDPVASAIKGTASISNHPLPPHYLRHSVSGAERVVC